MRPSSNGTITHICCICNHCEHRTENMHTVEPRHRQRPPSTMPITTTTHTKISLTGANAMYLYITCIGIGKSEWERDFDATERWTRRWNQIKDAKVVGFYIKTTELEIKINEMAKLARSKHHHPPPPSPLRISCYKISIVDDFYFTRNAKHFRPEPSTECRMLHEHEFRVLDVSFARRQCNTYIAFNAVDSLSISLLDAARHLLLVFYCARTTHRCGWMCVSTLVCARRSQQAAAYLPYLLHLYGVST